MISHAQVKLSVKFVSLECDGLVGGQLLPTARPYIVVDGDDASRESCLGDWCGGGGLVGCLEAFEWSFF